MDFLVNGMKNRGRFREVGVGGGSTVDQLQPNPASWTPA